LSIQQILDCARTIQAEIDNLNFVAQGPNDRANKQRVMSAAARECPFRRDPSDEVTFVVRSVSLSSSSPSSISGTSNGQATLLTRTWDFSARKAFYKAAANGRRVPINAA